MTKTTAFVTSLVLATAACNGGAISVEVAMPRRGGVTTNPDGSMTFASGVIVDGGDGTAVCERIRVSVYTSATVPSSPTSAPASAPVTTGRGLGTYDPASAAPKCVATIVNLAPRDDYWIVLDYPAKALSGDGSYYTEGRPSLFPVALRYGAAPIKVVDKQTTKLSGAFTVTRAVPGV